MWSEKLMQRTHESNTEYSLGNCEEHIPNTVTHNQSALISC